MNKLVLVRHGESIWNKENIFTGWVDVPLSEKGIEQAKEAGEVLKENGFTFELGFTSILLRAQTTIELILSQMHVSIPVERSWRLNERHYGALQGQNKDEVKKQYGEEKYLQWRRGYSVRPPDKNPETSYAYQEVGNGNAPMAESLEDTEKRLLPYWQKSILPELKKGKNVIIVAHGNSLRALVKTIDNIEPENMPEIEIPVAQPIIYDLDDNCSFVRHYYLDKNLSCNF